MKKIGVLIIVSTIALLCAWGLDEAHCYLNQCVEDDASLRAMAMIGWLIIPLYALLTIIPVFASAIVLYKKLPIWISSLIPSITLSLLIEAILFSPEVDDLIGVASLVVWLTVPWMCSSAVGLRLWRMG